MLLASFSTKVTAEAPLLIDSNPNIPVPEKRSKTIHLSNLYLRKSFENINSTNA